MEKQPSPNKPIEPISEDVIPSYSIDTGKHKVSEEIPNLGKEAKNPFVKVTKRKRYVPIVTNPTKSTLATPIPKWTRKTIEIKEVLARRRPCMQGRISPISTKNLNASVSKSLT